MEKFDHGAGGKENSTFFSPNKSVSVRPGTIPHATSDIKRTLHESKGIISPLDDIEFYTAQHREDFFNANIFKLKESEIFDNGVYRFEVALINTPDRDQNSIGLQLNCRISSQTTRPIFNFKIEIFADKSFGCETPTGGQLKWETVNPTGKINGKDNGVFLRS